MMKKIKSVKSLGIQSVYDVTTMSDNRNFVLSNGIVAHNCNTTQPALRNAMEEFASNCSFIFTCNYKNRIIEPLHSRCAVIDFTLRGPEKAKMASQFFKRIQNILDAEDIQYEPSVVAEFVQKHFPDFRRVLNELQRYSKFGKIDESLLTQLNANIKIDTIIGYLKKKDYTSLRKWVGSNDVDPSVIFHEIFDSLTDIIIPSSIPNAVVLMADYQYKHAFVADPQINLMAFFLEMMNGVEFK
jgi:replication factor C small subunit